MPDLLLELRSEEIPARMQRTAAGDLKKRVTDALVDAGLTYEGAREYWTPRRLTLDVRGVDAASRDVTEERKGPRTDAPQQAVDGFLRGAGLASVDEAETRSDPKKGEFYVAVIRKPGRAAEEVVAEVMPGIVKNFPWPKSMRWGKASAEPGALRWVRPLQSIVCTFGPETEEPVVVDFDVDGIRSGNVTRGHRFHAPDEFTVRRFDDYSDSLEKAFVVLDADRRKDMIRHDAENLAFAKGLEVVPDEGLLEEVSGLVEWPVTLMGEFEEAFLQIPPEVVQLTIKTNQKCFVTRSIGSGLEPPAKQAGMNGETALSNNFVLVSNIQASDGGTEIARGNGKVVRARLSDALYFWETDQADLPDLEELKPSAERFGLDLSKPLDQRMAKLDALGVTFHAKLGTQGERVARIAALAEAIAGEIAGQVSAEGVRVSEWAFATEELKRLARRAAVLAKADLPTEAVGEFPELQGLMGRYYAGLQGEHQSVQVAIEDHYKPLGPTDRVPTDPVAICVALADKLDTLVGFWAIDEKPTGSKDPYALRRAALGVIRIVLENGLKLPTADLVMQHSHIVSEDAQAEVQENNEVIRRAALKRIRKEFDIEALAATGRPRLTVHFAEAPSRICDGLLEFLHDRLKTQLRDQGARHDLVDAVLSGGTGAPTSPSWGGRGEAEGGGNEAASPPRDRSDRDPSHQRKGGRSAINDDLLDISRRVEALGAFLATEDGTNLLAGTRRAANILTAEEKKGTRIAETVDPGLMSTSEETALTDAIDRAEAELDVALTTSDYGAAMAALAKLRGPVDGFFDAVMVNDEDETVRANRLALLSRIRQATRKVADFGRIAG